VSRRCRNAGERQPCLRRKINQNFALDGRQLEIAEKPREAARLEVEYARRIA